MEKTYTKPILKKTTSSWYVEFYCLHPVTGKMEQVRKKSNLNRIKDLQEREALAEVVIDGYHSELKTGWNPFNEAGNQQILKDTISITVKEAKVLFEEYHTDLRTRKKTIQTYASKINYLIAYFPDTKVNTIDTVRLNEFFLEVVRKNDWSLETYKACKRILNSFFEWLRREKYITVNPLQDLDKLKITKETPDVHVVYSDEDFKEVRRRLKLYDPYTYLFTSLIFHCCLRPKEIKQLRVHNVNLDGVGYITVPASVMKTKTKRVIKLEPLLKDALMELNLEQYDKMDFLMGDTETIVSSTPIAENKPYNRLILALKGEYYNKKYNLEGEDKLTDLSNKQYSLYSIKHYSNVFRYVKLQWSVAKLQALNDHSSPVQTETYLKDLKVYMEDKEYELPAY